jgi:hypothetical protein
MTAGPTYYATDEDIALRASADFAILCPKDQKLAWGNDGAFSPANRWLLSSPSVDFQANGLMPGHVCQLAQPTAVFKPPGESYVVDTVAPGSVTLRRKGEATGVGQPPAPSGGLAQVEFAVTTLGPQIARASYELNRRYGIDDLVAGRRSSDLFDPQEVREATVLTVLYRQYLDMSRGQEGRGDTFAAKAQIFRQELDDLLARTVVHWLSVPGNVGAAPPTSRFGTRLSR